MIEEKFYIIYSKTELQVPLSQVNYDANGIRFKWNEIWLAIPYEQLNINPMTSHLFEEFKDHFKSKITIHLYWHRIFHRIEKLEVIINKNASDELNDIISHIKKIKSEINSLADTGTLTIDKARNVMIKNGFEFDDNRIHNILSEIINNLPLKQIQKVEVSLSDL